MILQSNNRNGFFIVGKSEEDISSLCLKRRMIDNKTKYYDVDVKVSCQNGEWFFDTKKFLSCSSSNKDYYLDIFAMEKIESISLPKDGMIRFDEAAIQFFISDDEGKINIKYRIVPLLHASVTTIDKNEDEIIVDFSTDIEKSDLTILFMRRSVVSRNGFYDKIIEKEAKGCRIKIPCNGFLNNYCERGGEIWDVAIRCNEIGYVYIETQDINIDYCDKDRYIAYKPFNSDGYLSIWTKEGENKDGNRVKMAILGSCYIKEAFHSLTFTNPDYKRFYDNVLVGFHHSLVSLTSSPVMESYNVISKYQREIELYSEHELKKNYFQKLAASGATYLLVDNYADATLAVGKDVEGRFFTKNYYFNNSNLFAEFINLERTYSQQEEERILLYEKALKAFKEKVKVIMPLSHIILISGRQSLYKQKEDYTKELWPDHDFYEKSNKLWEKLDNIFLKLIPEARRIDLRDNKYISVEKTPLQCTPNHFQSEYYRKELNEFNKIVLFDMLHEKEEKKISVIIPCYNAADTIKRCLQSIVNQAGNDIEVICVDDGSTDATTKVLQQFGSRVTVVQKEHGGVSSARNVGMRKATGKWVWFVDSDDEIMPNAIRKISETVSDERDFYCFSAKIVNNPRANYRLDDIVLADKAIDKDVFSYMVKEYNKPFVWNCVYKKSFLEENDIFFPIGQEIGEDMCFQMMVFENAKNALLSSFPIYTYHYLEENGVMQRTLGTKERAVQHVGIVRNVFKKSNVEGKERDILNNWAFSIVDPECFLYAESVRLMNKVWKEYHVKINDIQLKKRTKNRMLYSKMLCELYILVKGRK